MKIEAISKKLVKLLRDREFIQAQQELFDSAVQSIEPAFHPNPKTVGISNLLNKEQAFLEAIKTWHAFEVSDPVVSSDHFCIRMYSKLTIHNEQHMEVDELIVYEVANGKIVKEQFFYATPLH